MNASFVARCAATTIALLWLPVAALSQSAPRVQAGPTPPAAATAATPQDLPYVYTDWKHFTVKEGLPNDHIFAVKAEGDCVWIGTEDGLARLDKRSGKIRAWREKDGLPWRAVTALDVNKKTGEVWIGLFGGGVARYSGGRFDHFHQLNSGLVNDVVYGIAVENDNVWIATTAGASRYNTITNQWTTFTEKTAPMEEIWNYGVSCDRGKVYLAVWGSGVLEFDVATEHWKTYLDPDREMEIDLYRDDGIVHVITTGVSHVDGTMWVSTYFGNCRYDGRHWRGFYAHETGIPSDFTNFVKARSANEAWYATDKGVGVVADFPSDTYVAYTRDPDTLRGKAVVYRGNKPLKTYDLERSVPHNFTIGLDFDGNDVWVATSKGLGWGIGKDYYPRLKRVAAKPVNVPTPAAAKPDVKSTPPAGEKPAVELSPEVATILRQLNGLNAYQTPNLPLKTDAKYAHTDKQLEPFHHVEPFKRHFLAQMEYTGPGRAIPEPDDVKTVKIGFIGPIAPTVSVATGGKSHEESLGAAMLQGAKLAVEEANARGGYAKRNIPFELVVSNDNGLWGSSGNEIIKMAYKDDVWAILGTIDSANSHIAIRVALKAEVLVMNSGDTDPTYIETNIPWTCRVINDDRQMDYILVDYLYRKLGVKRVGIVRASNRYGRFGVREINDASRRLGHPIVLEMAYPLGAEDFALQIERLAQENLDAVIHWGDAADGARILNQMRARGMKQPYFACDRCLSDEFLKIAGRNAEGVMCAYPWNPTRTDEKYQAFRAAYKKRFGDAPETYAAHAYDGMQMLLWATQAAGLNRAKIRDLIAYRTEPWKGVTGDIVLSSALDNIGDVYLARREKGEWKYFSREDLGIPKAAAPTARAPFFDGRTRPTDYAGPGRDAPPEADVREVLLGYFGPHDPADAEGGDAWQAAQLAVAEANAAGGYGGKPFRLVPAWSPNPWTSGVAKLARLVYEDRVWGIVGNIDGPSAHLAEQVAVKARLPVLSAGNTDRTVHAANVPWIFSMLASDQRQAPALAAGLAAQVNDRPLALVSTDDHDARLFASELTKALSQRAVTPQTRIECRRGAADAAETAKSVLAAKPQAVALVADARDTARLLVDLRAAGYRGAVFGGPAMGRGRFLREAGAAADGAVFPRLGDPRLDDSEFAQTFRSRCGREPDYLAAASYDAARLMIDAVRKAGLNRARIRDAIADISPWQGAGGSVAWDNAGGNVRDVSLGTVQNGRIAAADEEERSRP